MFLLCLRPTDRGGYILFSTYWILLLKSQKDDKFYRQTLRHAWLMSSSLAHTNKCLLVMLALYKEQVNRNNKLTGKKS